MRNFIIEQSPSEIYTSAAGLTLVGQCLNKHTPLPKSARSLPKRHGIANIDLIPLLDETSVAFLQSVQAPVAALDTGQVALDVDVFPQDNGGTKKEGVSRTCKPNVDGYAPITACPGSRGLVPGLRAAARIPAEPEGVRVQAGADHPAGPGPDRCAVAAAPRQRP